MEASKKMYLEMRKHQAEINFLLLLPFFVPPVVDDFVPIAAKAITVVQVLSLIAGAFLIITRRIRINLLFVSIAVYQGYLCAVTVLNGGNVFGIASSTARVLALYALLWWGISRNKDMVINYLRIYFLILSVAMLVATIIKPEGLYLVSSAATEEGNNPNNVRYLLGHKNNILMFVFPGLLSSAVYWLESRSKIDGTVFAVMLAATGLSVIVIDSATSLVVCILVACAAVLAQLNPVKSSNPFIWLTGALISDIAITVVKIQELIPFITKVFHRTVTFSGRAAIWDQTIELITQRPLFGYGYELESVTKSRLPGDSFTSSHNIYLTAGYYGGIIGIVLLLSCIAISMNCLKTLKSSSACFIKLFIVIVLIEGIFETVGSGGLTMLVIPLTFAQCAGSFADNQPTTNR